VLDAMAGVPRHEFVPSREVGRAGPGHQRLCLVNQPVPVTLPAIHFGFGAVILVTPAC
jgi:hypothetical protein